MGEWISEASAWIVAFVRDHREMVPPVVFLLGMGESIAGLSLLIPSTFLFLAIGGVDSASGGQFWPVWVAGAAGAFLGDTLSFALGRIFRSDIGGVWPFRTRPALFVVTRTAVTRWGALAVIGSKFTAGVRPLVPVVAGALGTGWPAFLAASAVSCLLWAGVFLAPGYGIALVWR